MAKQVYLFLSDGGHGKGTPGKETPMIKELGRKIKEHEFNSAVTDIIGTLCKLNGIEFVDVAPGDTDHSLTARTNKANKIYKEYCDKYGKANVHCVYVSVHYDAMSNTFSAAEGITVFVYNGHKNKEAGKLATVVGNELKKGTSQKYRGVKEANFAVLRQTNMIAILTENGFMSNSREARLMLNKAFQWEVATETVRGVFKYWGKSFKAQEIKKADPKTPSKSGYTYRVVTGSFEDKPNAQKRVNALEKKKFDSFISADKVNGKTTYRVVTGSYTDKDNANKQVSALKKDGFDSFLMAVKK